jgi:hypothetical protein
VSEIIAYLKDDWLALTAIIVSIFSLAFTILNSVKNRRHTDDKELLEQLKQSMELAYECINNKNRMPSNNRNHWLTSARHITRYRQLKSSLKTGLFKTICDEKEEYWRNEFHKLLQGIEDISHFTAINLDTVDSEKIEPMSAAIVYSMSTWPKDKPDPIDSEPFEDIVNRYQLFSRSNRPFHDYIKHNYPGFYSKAKSKYEH